MEAEGVPALAGGPARPTWYALPLIVRAAIEEHLRSQVVTATNARGGFTPGLAATLVLADGRRVFAKAISATLSEVGASQYRREAANVPRLPRSVPAPRLLWHYDDGNWVALLLSIVDGRPPAQPWRTSELEQVLSSIGDLSDLLTPAPFTDPRLVEVRAADFTGWRDLEAAWPASASGLATYNPWVTDHLDVLAQLESTWQLVADGDSLLHGDLRADNMLLTDNGVVFVDWPDACVGAGWVDLLFMLPSVAMQGGPTPEQIVQRHPLTRDLDPQVVDVMAATVAGYFVARSLMPAPRGLPTIRAFQRAQGVEAIRWLRARLP
jgi:aminoglycoside phosphotransferase